MTFLYHYDNQRLFISQTEARMNPLDPDVPLIPANSTLLEPSEISEYEISRFEDESWKTISDYRGYRCYTIENGEELITDVNVTPSSDAIELNANDSVIQNEDGTWRLRTEDDDLNDLKQYKIHKLMALVDSDINSGFESTALDTNHYYDSEQYNVDWIQASALLNDDALITCDDLKGNVDSKQPRNHTAEQNLHVLKDGMAALLSFKTKFRDLRDRVNAASDESEVENINW